MTQQELEALLGRSLTPREQTNLNLYLEIAQENLESLLCTSLELQDGSDPEEQERTYEPREGYKTIFTDVFTDVSSVEVNGQAVDYYPAFWDKRNAGFYNSIVLSKRTNKEVTITAIWGFPEWPSDLKQLIAQAFANVSEKYEVKDVKSKRVEDFQVTYGDLSDDEAFVKNNAVTINKYSQCKVGYIKHGKVCRSHGVYDCGYCF